MSIFSFLSNQSLAANTDVKPAKASTGSRALERNPTEADIRVFKSGAVYPSIALIQQDNLAYLPKDATGVANGYDVVNSKQFLNTQGWDKAVLFIALVCKTAAKVDLFGRTTYDENGVPSDVASQGATTFGKELLETLKEVYGYEIPEGENFVDLKIVTDFTFNTPDNIYYLPKPISKGTRKGEIDLIRRENLTLNLLMPLSMFKTEMGEVPEADGVEPGVTAPETEEEVNPVEIAVENHSIEAEVAIEEEESEVEAAADTESSMFDFSADN